MRTEDGVTYADEEILRKREEQKRLTHNSIEKGAYIKGVIIEFKRYQIADKFTISLPDTWEYMPEELARVKYPTDFRPQCIMTSKDLSVNMGFSVFPHELQVEDVKNMAERVMTTIIGDNPGYRFYQFAELENIKGYWFSFRSHAMDSDLYNQIMITPIDHTIMMANFNCLYEDCAEWEKTVLQMWESMEEMNEEGRKR